MNNRLEIIAELEELFFAVEFLHVVPVLNFILVGVAGFFVAIYQRKKGYRTSYTRVEKEALEAEAISLEDVRGYHAQISWGSYSIFMISLFCVMVSIIYTELAEIGSFDRVALTLAAMLLGVAGTVMLCADLVHTNGISPVLGVDDRFRIINSGITASVASILILLAGMQTFALLISKSLMIVLCVIELLAVIRFSFVRSIVDPSYTR